MADERDRRGVLYPARLPQFERILPPPELKDLVGWFWLVHWDIAAGRTSRQQLLPFPLMNLVVQREGVTLSGPASAASHRDLAGKGWAVAALLRPAAATALALSPATLIDREVGFETPELLQDISRILGKRNGPAANPESARALGAWFTRSCPAPDANGLRANEFIDYVAATRSAVSVEQVAEALGFSVRSLQRLSLRYVGLPPLAVIRRYRLQEAAQRVRENPSASIAQIAAELRYTDQAHLAADFRRILGFSPSTYRAHSQSAGPQSENES